MGANGCMPLQEDGLRIVSQHNQAIVDGIPCLGEQCPVMLCPFVESKFHVFMGVIADLERRINQLQSDCQSHQCPGCRTLKGEMAASA